MLATPKAPTSRDRSPDIIRESLKLKGKQSKKASKQPVGSEDTPLTRAGSLEPPKESVQETKRAKTPEGKSPKKRIIKLKLKRSQSPGRILEDEKGESQSPPKARKGKPPSANDGSEITFTPITNATALANELNNLMVTGTEEVQPMDILEDDFNLDGEVELPEGYELGSDEGLWTPLTTPLKTPPATPVPARSPSPPKRSKIPDFVYKVSDHEPMHESITSRPKGKSPVQVRARTPQRSPLSLRGIPLSPRTSAKQVLKPNQLPVKSPSGAVRRPLLMSHLPSRQVSASVPKPLPKASKVYEQREQSFSPPLQDEYMQSPSDPEEPRYYIDPVDYAYRLQGMDMTPSPPKPYREYYTETQMKRGDPIPRRDYGPYRPTYEPIQRDSRKHLSVEDDAYTQAVSPERIRGALQARDQQRATERRGLHVEGEGHSPPRRRHSSPAKGDHLSDKQRVAKSSEQHRDSKGSQKYRATSPTATDSDVEAELNNILDARWSDRSEQEEAIRSLLASVQRKKSSAAPKVKSNLKVPAEVSLEFETVKPGGVTMAETIELFLARFKDWAYVHGVKASSPEYMIYASSCLKGRAELQYRRAVQANGNKHLAPTQFEKFLRGLTLGTSVTGFDLMDQIMDFSFREYHNKDVPVVQAVAELDSLFRRIDPSRDFPEWLQCYALNRACPRRFRKESRFDQAEAARTGNAAQEYTDYAKLKEQVLLQSQTLTEELEQTSYSRHQRTGHSYPKRHAEVHSIEGDAKRRRDSSSQAQPPRRPANGSVSERQKHNDRNTPTYEPKDRFDPETEVPVSDRKAHPEPKHWNHWPGISFADLKRKYLDRNICPLCKKRGHRLNQCDPELREQAFKEGTFFYYPTKYKFGTKQA